MGLQATAFFNWLLLCHGTSASPMMSVVMMRKTVAAEYHRALEFVVEVVEVKVVLVEAERVPNQLVRTYLMIVLRG